MYNTWFALMIRMIRMINNNLFDLLLLGNLSTRHLAISYHGPSGHKTFTPTTQQQQPPVSSAAAEDEPRHWTSGSANSCRSLVNFEDFAHLPWLLRR
jgi:hypothetical protein